MKLTVKTKAILSALLRVGVATDARGTLPILSSVLLNAKDGKLVLSATNLEIYITETIEAVTIEDGSAVIAYRLLSSFLSRATSMEVQMESEDGKELIVTSGEAVARFESLPAEEFPPPLRVEGEAVTFNSADLLKPLAMVKHAISTEESRYVLMGVNFKSADGRVDIAATDGRRIARYRANLPLPGIDVIIPGPTVAAILRVMEGDHLRATMGEGGMILESDTLELRSKFIEGKYPNYQQITPDESSNGAFSAQRKELSESIRTASLFLKDREIAIALTGKGKELEVACSDRFKATLLGAELEGQPKLTKRCDFRFLLESLSVLENETVRIECHKDRTPLVLREGPYIEVINSLTEPK